MSKSKITYFNLILTLILFSFSSCITHAQTKSSDIRIINGKKFYIHKVEKGQSLYAIAKVYNMDVNAILAENDDAIDGIKNGQELKIPVENSQVKPVNPIDTNKYVYHKVLKGETIYFITKKYNIDETKLKALNPNLVNGLKEGDYLAVFHKKTGSTKANGTFTNNILGDQNALTTYTVQQSETLYGISKKFNISQDDILKWNPEVKEGIKQGQVLKLALNGKTAVTTNTLTSELTNDVKDTLPINTTKKEKYQIGLFLPFKFAESEAIVVEDLVKAKLAFPSSQSLALDFYSGFKAAVDSLTSAKFELNINLFDIDDKDSSKIETICKGQEFKKLDVIFGPMYLSGFKIVSHYAKLQGTPIVSPVIQQNKILYKNRLVSKVSPSLYTLIEGLSDYCIDSLMASSNIMLVNSTAKDLGYIKAFKDQYNIGLNKHGKTLKDSLITVKGFAGVKTAFVPNKKNVVVLLTNNQVYLQDFITQLAAFSDKKDIVLMGFSSVSSLDNLDQEYLNKLQFHFADAGFVDYTQPIAQQLTKNYQNIYGADPSEYYFNGFDIAYYFLSNLKNEGTSLFLNLDQYPYSGISTGFKFYHPDSETGFENRGVSIYKYSNYKLQKLGWK